MAQRPERPRIVSLLPSATEILFALGLDEQIAGVTHECDYPAAALAKPRITTSKANESLTSREIDALVRLQLDTTGSIYELDMAKLERLKPDLILTQQLCTVCAVSFDFVRDEAAKLSTMPEVVNLEPKTVGDVLDSIRLVGKLSGVPEVAERVAGELQSRIDAIERSVLGLKQPRVIVLEWVDPLFASGHWIPELVERAGGINALAFKHAPSREVTWDKVLASQPDVVVIAECGFSVERQRQDADFLLSRMDLEWVGLHRPEQGSTDPKGFAGSETPEVWVCDGSMYFSRPGPRLVETLELLAGILHPELRAHWHAKFSNKDIVQLR